MNRLAAIGLATLSTLGACSLLFNKGEEPAADVDTTDVDATAGGPIDGPVEEAGLECLEPWQSWEKRMPLSLEASFIGGEELIDFPVLVRISASEAAALGLKADASDLRFSDAGGAPLAYEIEARSAGQGFHVWVRVPQVNTETETQLWMYGGNAGAVDGQQTVDVWSNDFLSVWHVDPQAAGGITYDSAANRGYNAVSSGIGISPAAAGAIGGAEFFGSSGLLQFSDYPGDTITGPLTVEVRLHLPTVTTSNSRFVVHRAEVFGLLANEIGMNPGPSQFSIQPVGVNSLQTLDGPVIARDEWHYIVGVYNRQSPALHFYVDGQKVISSSLPNVIAGAKLVTNSNTLVLGLNLEGTLDEVRLSKAVRSDGWLKAQNASMNDTLIRRGSTSGCP